MEFDLLRIARTTWLAFLLVMLFGNVPIQAQLGSPPVNGEHVGSMQESRSCCLCGEKVCSLKITQQQTSVKAFEVESKEVCIPGFQVPWDPNGPRRGGGIRKVCVLKDETDEKTTYQYDWSVKTICMRCCRDHGLPYGKHAASRVVDPRVPFEFYVAARETQVSRKRGANDERSGVAPRKLQAQFASEKRTAEPSPQTLERKSWWSNLLGNFTARSGDATAN